MPLHPEDARLVSYIAHAENILVFTGAGISTKSGIPDFRGPGGVWEKRKPVYYQDFLTSHEARQEHWDYKLEGWEAFKQAQPNSVHAAIVTLDHFDKLRAVVTQNIDGLHQKAGTREEKLIELHGTNAWVECTCCGKRYDPDPIYEQYARDRIPPVCGCSSEGFLKPATISFGQNLRTQDLQAAERAAHECDLVIALGSTLSVYPAASVPLVATQRGVPYIVINRGPTDHDHLEQVTLRLEGCVSDWFPPAVEAALRC